MDLCFGLLYLWLCAELTYFIVLIL